MSTIVSWWEIQRLSYDIENHVPFNTINKCYVLFLFVLTALFLPHENFNAPNDAKPETNDVGRIFFRGAFRFVFISSGVFFSASINFISSDVRKQKVFFHSFYFLILDPKHYFIEILSPGIL